MTPPTFTDILLAKQTVVRYLSQTPLVHYPALERYWEEDIIEPPVVVSPRGTITAPMDSGIGYEVKENLIETLAVKRESLSLA